MLAVRVLAYLLRLACGCTPVLKQYEDLAPRVGDVMYCQKCKRDVAVQSVREL